MAIAAAPAMQAIIARRIANWLNSSNVMAPKTVRKPSPAKARIAKIAINRSMPPGPEARAGVAGEDMVEGEDMAALCWRPWDCEV